MKSENRKALLAFSREILKASFRQFDEDVLKKANQTLPQDPEIRGSFPCFVTLYENKEQLRGCIGCTETSESLIDNVAYFTRAAAFQDPRFPAVEEDEVDGLTISISVLGKQQPMKSLSQIEIGKHGLVVGKGGRRGLLLADVATKYDWTKEKFLKETCNKAGLSPMNLDQYEVTFFEQISFSE